MSKKKNILPGESKHVLNVQAFYNAYNDKFLQVYGDIIQAFRTTQVETLLASQAQSMRLAPGMKVLDAGCGVCGPAIYFAEQIQALTIEACTISPVQAEAAATRIHASTAGSRIQVKVGDYHQLDQLYGKEIFDRVYFLESFGHSDQKKKLIEAVWHGLKPGGMVYIKDLFRRESDNEWEQLRIDHICNQIDDAYEYRIANLGDVLAYIRKKGFILHFVKIPEVSLSDFEKLTISNDFQNLFDVGKIDSWDDYVFPIDFYEILAEKPQMENTQDMHLYFMNKENGA